MKKREFNDFYAQSMEIYNRCQREIIKIMIEKGVDSVNIHEDNVDDACYLAHCNFNGDWESSRIEEIKFKGEYIRKMIMVVIYLSVISQMMQCISSMSMFMNL